MHSVIDACLQALSEHKEEKAARIAACEQFIEELQKMRGEDLEPHLSEMVLRKENHILKITFDFPIPSEQKAEKISKNEDVVIGIKNYNINQGLSEIGQLVLDLTVINPSQECEVYAAFIQKFNGFLKQQGYSGYVLAET